MLFIRGLLLGLVTGALSAPSGEWGTWLPGLVFAANFLPWKQGWLKKLGATAVSLGAWWVAHKGAASAAEARGTQGLLATEQMQFWAQWGALGAVLLGLGLLAFGFFTGKRRFYALPLLALAGAIAAQPFAEPGDRGLYLGFIAWQGLIAALLSTMTQADRHHDL